MTAPILSLVLLLFTVQPHPIQELSPLDFRPFVDAQPTLVLFYVSWCPYCQRFLPEFDKAEELLGQSPIKLAKVNCEKQSDICKQFVSEGYPTIFFFQFAQRHFFFLFPCTILFMSLEKARRRCTMEREREQPSWSGSTIISFDPYPFFKVARKQMNLLPHILLHWLEHFRP
jgi:thiol-disulfide isomerase/thioredoxin